MDLQQLIERAREIRSKYADFETKRNGREWTGEELVLGFVGDVGDLAKLVQAKEGIRTAENVDDALAHELSDCMWSIIVLADKYGVDLEKAFVKTMDELETRLNSSPL
ncbi:MAG TPA: MazG nucleotide pyrophosphohydrolase domain-containing protein [Candidatus Saccharibacteria bacterium]|nr:MazG nucleotide pyrophosphohydrolase domain-containing protein [Candidatus Saccharibacteria bacterium]